MMTLEDYASDVSLSVEEVKALCDKIGINYDGDDTLLDDVSITLLDNEIQEKEDYIATDSYELEEKMREEEVVDKAEELAFSTKIDLDNSTSFTKVKSKKSNKSEPLKKDFLKERKKIYKHREKLGDNKSEDDVIVYHEKMTPASLAGTLKVSPTEIVKKLFNLGIMANVNQVLNFDTVELILLDYRLE